MWSPRAHTTPDKFHLPVEDSFCHEPLPLTAVFHLDAGGSGQAGGVRRLRGSEAVARVGQNLYRHRLLMHLGRSTDLLAASALITRILGGTWAVAHGHTPGGLDLSVAAILQHVSA